MIRSKIAEIVENISNVQDQDTLINDAISMALDQVYQAHDWPYYMQEGAIRTVAVYDTGTAAVTQDSATVTITTGVVVAGFAGRKFRVDSERPYYRILSVDTTANTLTLEQPYQGSNNATASYEIFKDEYRLAADVDKYKLMRQIQNGIPMWDITPKMFDQRFPTPQSYGDPMYDIMVGTKLDIYTNGTLSASGNTLTGDASCLWTGVEGLGRMSKLRIGNSTYTVKSVDSDTQITTYESVGTIAAGTSYEIILDNIVIQFYQIPNTARLIYYRYFRIPKPLVNDYDTPDMPNGWDDTLVHGALYIMWRQKGDLPAAGASKADFDQDINSMKLKVGSFAPDRISARKSVDSIKRGRRFDGLETSNFDRKYSW